MTKWEITQNRKCIFIQNFACKVRLLKDIFPENFMKIDSEMAEKIVDQTRTKNNNKKKEEEETSE